MSRCDFGVSYLGVEAWGCRGGGAANARQVLVGFSVFVSNNESSSFAAGFLMLETFDFIVLVGRVPV